MHVLQRVSNLFKSGSQQRPGLSRTGLIAVATAGILAVGGIAVVVTRSASDQFANAAFSKLGDDPQEVLNTIAEKVVAQLSSKGGSFDSAQEALVKQIAGAAGDKLDGVDAEGLLDSVKGDVLAASLGKLDGISTDGIVDQVTAALIAQAEAEIAKLDLEKLAANLINSVDIDKLVNEKLKDVDVDAIVNKLISEQLGGGSSGGLGNLTTLLQLFGQN
jgi:hypothetical protein